MRLYNKIMFLQSPELGSRDARTPLKFCKVDFVNTKVCTRFLLHFFDGLCYNSLQVITYDVFLYIVLLLLDAMANISIRDVQASGNDFIIF